MFGSAVAAAALSAVPALAANDAYSIAPVDGTFSGMNWTVGSTVGGAPTGTVASGDSLYFDGSTITTLTNDDTGFTFAGFKFNSDAAAYNISGNAVTLSGAITNLGANAQQINLGLTLSAAQLVNTTGAGTVTLGGSITGGFGMVKTGAAQLTLSNSSSYTGGTEILGGTLRLTNAAAAGTGPINLAGGTLSTNSALANVVNVLTASTYTQGSDLALPVFNGSTGAVLNLGLTDSTGKFNTEGTYLAGFFGTLELGASTGAFRFTSNGAPYATIDLGTSTASLVNALGSSGTVTIGALAGGTNTVLSGNTSSNRTTTYNVGGNNSSTEFDGLITDGTFTTPGADSLVKTGTGTLTLTHAETYTGTTQSANGGTLAVAFPSTTTANVLPNTALTLAGGGLTLTGSAGAANTQAFTSLTVNGGPGRLVATPGAGGTTAVTISGGTFRNAGGTLQVATTGSVAFAGNASSAIVTDTSLNPFVTLGTDDWAATTATGAVVAATYTPIASGAITSGVIDDIQGSATASSANPLAVRFSNTAATGVVTLTNTGTSTLRGVLMTSTSPGAVIAGTGTFIRPNRTTVQPATFSFFQASTIGDLTVNPIISNAASSYVVAVSKSGVGRLLLTGVNTYTGATYVNEGVLSVAANSGLGLETTGAAVNLYNGDLETTTTFALENSATALTNERPVTVNGNGGLYAATGTTLTVNGVVSGPGVLNVDPVGGTYVDSAATIADAGTVTLAGFNTLAGGINVNAGTLVANLSNNAVNPVGSALGNPQVGRNVTVNNGATLQFANGDTLGGATSTIQTQLVINAGGVVTNNGTSYNTLGPVALNGGTLTGSGGSGNTQYQMYGLFGTVTVGGTTASTISSTGTTTTGYHLSANTLFNVANATGNVASDLNVSGTLIDQTGSQSLAPGALTKTGVGTMALTAANTYTGGTTAAGGVLQANNATSALGTGTTSVVTGGTLAGTGATGGPVAVYTGGTVTAGTGATAADVVGTLNTGAQTWNVNGNYAAKLTGDGSTAGTTADKLVMSGLTINAANVSGSQFTVTPVGAGSTVTLGSGNQFLIATDTVTTTANPYAAAIAAGSLVLGTSSTVLPATGDSLSLVSTQDSGGYELYLADVSSAPEPTSLLLAAVAAGPLALGRRRRSRTA